ncbi:IS1380 family transposase [bacterium]|nr:IS1380 family transposase [bacterium]
MSLQGVFQKCFSLGALKPVVVEVSDAAMTSDAGLIPIRQFDQVVGLSERFSGALDDFRDPARTRHRLLEMVRARMYGIPAGYEDQDDHDTLRSDPVFKLIADRSPDTGDLASQPTHSRFENAVSVRSLLRLRDVFIDQFIGSFEQPPAQLTLDMDPFDDPAHGQQQLIMFHGYYGQYQYLPRVITCAENDQVVMFCLLFGTANPALEADDDLEYLIDRLRAAWPDVRIHLRADSAFGVPLMFDVCERLSIDYSFGVRMNATLKPASDDLLTAALKAFEETGQPQRLFESIDYRAGSWRSPRCTIIKVEVHARGTNRRAIVTSRPGARVLPAASYNEYADRGESDRHRRNECGCASAAR